jgi:hypothetical protein
LRKIRFRIYMASIFGMKKKEEKIYFIEKIS